ncbi:hypothetical protein ACB092_03G059800 [Castanea dentata]
MRILVQQVFSHLQKNCQKILSVVMTTFIEPLTCIPRANENFWIKFPMNKNGWMNSQKEIKILQKVVDTMKVQLNELQMCKLKLQDK